MAIVDVIAPGALMSVWPAYRPIVFLAQDIGAVRYAPVVYCDVYFDGVYYKTIIATTPYVRFNALNALFRFDIQGLAQEYQRTLVPDLAVTPYPLQQVYLEGSGRQYGMCKCWVKIRTSSVDSYGVVTPETPAPVQRTVDTPPIEGVGAVSGAIYIVNASLQVMDSQDLVYQTMQFKRTGPISVSPYYVDADYKVYPLSYNKNLRSYKNDHGCVPILTGHVAFLGTGFLPHIALAVEVYNSAGARLIYQDTWAEGTVITMRQNSIYLMPTGWKDILALFPTIAAYWDAAAYYQVGLYDRDRWAVADYRWLYVSQKITAEKGDGALEAYNPLQGPALPKHTRIWFQNYLGQFEQVNFIEREEATKVTSTVTERGLVNAPNYQYLQPKSFRSDASVGRNNVNSVDENTVTGQFNETDMPLLKQLFGSAKVFIEFMSPEARPYVLGITERDAVLLPVTLVDADYTTQVFEDRSEYRVSVKYILSNENITVRN